MVLMYVQMALNFLLYVYAWNVNITSMKSLLLGDSSTSMARDISFERGREDPDAPSATGLYYHRLWSDDDADNDIISVESFHSNYDTDTDRVRQLSVA